MSSLLFQRKSKIILNQKNDSKYNQLLLLSLKTDNFKSNFSIILDDPILVKNDNFKLALKNIFYNTILTNYGKINIYGFTDNVNIPELGSNKTSLILNEILKSFKSNNNIDQNLITYNQELSKLFEIFNRIKNNHFNNSQLLKAYTYLKQIKNYLTWWKFNEITDKKFKEINNNFIQKFKTVYNEYKEIIKNIKNYDLLDTINISINENLSFNEFETVIKEKFMKYAKLHQIPGESLQLIFNEFILKYEIFSNFENSFQEVNNTFNDSQFEIKINYKKNKTKTIKIFCDAIINKNSKDEINLLKRFNPNREFTSSFSNPDYISLSKTRINSIEFIFKNEKNEFINFEVGEIVLELILKEF